MGVADHWDRIYRSKGDRDVSWFEAVPAQSLQMIEDAGLTTATCVVDVGGGNSRLIDCLIDRGLTCLAVLDVSAVALEGTRLRLGDAGANVTWIVSDVTGARALGPIDIWHDRAVFHFLTAAADRAEYVARLRETLKPGGTAIIATFALDGPQTCSGLPIVRYSPETLAAELGDGFTLVDASRCQHRTPWGTTQSFQYSRFKRDGYV